MIGYLLTALRRKRVKPAALLDRKSDDFRMQNAQFVSFLEQSDFRKRQLNRHDKAKRLKKLVSHGIGWLITGGMLWVALESAHALELF